MRIARRFAARGYPGGMIPGIARLFPIWFRGTNDQVLYNSVPGTLAEIQANLEFGRRNNGSENGRIRPMMAPHATDTHTPETMRAIAAAAAELGNGVHIHLSQSANETNTVKRLWGTTPAQWCADLGLMNGPFFGAHMSGLDFNVDPPVLNAYGAVYSHCPSAGGAGGGTQPYPEALAKGMNVNIGIDTHSNDYVENLKLAVLYGQARHSLIATTSPTPLKRPDMWMAIDGTLLVEGNVGNSAPAAYSFNVDPRGHVDLPPLAGTGITIGSTVSGTIGTAGQQDDYLFTVTDPVRLYFDSLASDSDLYWSLTGPRGTEVDGRSFDTSDSNGLGGSPVLELDVPGTYRLRVNSTGSGTGAYGFRLLDLGVSTPIAPGTPVSGTLDPGNETDAYRFTAQAGDGLYFNSLSITPYYTYTYWRLLDPYGGMVFGPQYFNDVDVLTRV